MTRLEQLLELRAAVAREIAREIRGNTPAPRFKAKVAECGTESGYTRHRRAHEPTCTACRAAHRLAENERAARRRATIREIGIAS